MSKPAVIRHKIKQPNMIATIGFGMNGKSTIAITVTQGFITAAVSKSTPMMAVKKLIESMKATIRGIR